MVVMSVGWINYSKHISCYNSVHRELLNYCLCSSLSLLFLDEEMMSNYVANYFLSLQITISDYCVFLRHLYNKFMVGKQG
mmetsp:Transcript_23015/g.47311  ORF Transcript_23015/g.47311 Transcript_23015/m.47311 type:complete len:80 (+) Transcript_23015:421-660(+)